MDKHDRAELNLLALERASAYLTRCPRLIGEDDVRAVTAMGVSAEQAAALLFCSACGLDDGSEAGRELTDRYFRPTIRRLDTGMLADNPYMQAVSFPGARLGRWEMTRLSYAPYEFFVRDDLLLLPDGREIPQLGFFDQTVSYPAVLQDGREWMTVTPNEIATMEDAVSSACGHVCAMGLGLGYFAFMAGRKDDVTQVTVVERDKEVIALFRRFLLKQFPCRDKIRIVPADAFDYVKADMAKDGVDFAFVDLWHDVSDGAPLYLKMKALEHCAPETRFSYWVETSIRAFLRSLKTA